MGPPELVLELHVEVKPKTDGQPPFADDCPDTAPYSGAGGELARVGMRVGGGRTVGGGGEIVLGKERIEQELSL